jgi:cation:H+ antiporter
MEMSGGEKAQVILVGLSLIPFVAVLFFGLGESIPVIVLAVTGLGIIAAGYALAWGTEALQFIISEVVALAFLGVVQILPEYSIEAVLAFHGASDPLLLTFATASMTGANRLLLGVGWPAIVIIGYIASKRRGEDPGKFVKLERSQSVGVFFLAMATLYSFVIVVKATLNIGDAVILSAIYGSYIYVANKVPPRHEEQLEKVEGPSLLVIRMSRAKKALSILLLIAFGAFVTFFAAGPFIQSIIQLGEQFSIDKYFLIQWLAPFLTEFPEGITAAYWASRTKLAPLAIANLVSSKVNQWTLLIGTIPIAYAAGLAGLGSIHLTSLQIEELFLTAAQSVFGVACLIDLKFDRLEGVLLLGVFLFQFFVPIARLEISVVYLLLAAFEIIKSRKELVLFSEFKRVFKGHSP